MKTIFITGTDTGVGKTMVTAGLAVALILKNHRVGIMKPIACGSLDDSRFLQGVSGSQDTLELITPIFLKNPLSPNVAAKLERKKIDLGKISKAHVELKQKGYEYLIVEGCGGLLVPVTKAFWVADLIPMLRAETVLVSRSGLGAINHCLLSLEALRRRKIEPLGVVFNRLSGGPMSVPEQTNPEVVAQFGRIRSLGVFPHMKGSCAANCLGKAFLKHIGLQAIL